MSSGTGKDKSKAPLRAADLVLGRKAAKYINVLCLCGLAACVGIALFIFTNVPWDTRMPYDGKYNRAGTGIPMQIAMLPVLVVVVGMWRSARKADSHEMNKASRVVSYALGTAIVLGGILGQWIMGQSILVSGGYLPG
jgi:4-hydroxybenzoate polyprenyltransferase